VIVAYEAETGLRLARTEKPDLVILDIMLPKMDGYEICRRLKRPGMPSHSYYFGLCGGPKVDTDLGKKVGADDYSRSLLSLHLLAKIKELTKISK